jgi:hypothetical protein
VLFEAMAVGVPKLAARAGGVPGVLPEGIASPLPPEDPMTLGRNVQSVLEAPEQASHSAFPAQARLAQECAAGPWVDRDIAANSPAAGAAGSAQ